MPHNNQESHWQTPPHHSDGCGDEHATSRLYGTRFERLLTLTHVSTLQLNKSVAMLISPSSETLDTQHGHSQQHPVCIRRVLVPIQRDRRDLTTGSHNSQTRPLQRRNNRGHMHADRPPPSYGQQTQHGRRPTSAPPASKLSNPEALTPAASPRPPPLAPAAAKVVDKHTARTAPPATGEAAAKASPSPSPKSPRHNTTHPRMTTRTRQPPLASVHNHHVRHRPEPDSR